MSTDTFQLTQLQDKLQRLASQLGQDRRAPSVPIDAADPLVAQAAECDFMLPSPLTVATLQETVQKKIDTVAVLIERAEKHESLPVQAQVAADDENAFIEADYAPAADLKSTDGNGAT